MPRKQTQPFIAKDFQENPDHAQLSPWEIGKLRDTLTREAYSQWLQSLDWDYFLTVTFRKPRVDGIRANDVVWDCIWNMNIERAFLTAESFKSSKEVHVHGLIAGHPGMPYQTWLPWAMWERLYKIHGRSRVEGIGNPGQVANYCSKYVVKGLANYGFYGNPAFW